MSAATTNTISSTSRIIKTLYRQLLRWCKDAPPHIPLATLVPPVTLEAPANVDAFRLEVLATVIPPSPLDDPIVSRVRNLLPDRAKIEKNSLSVPIRSVQDVQGTIRSVFRLNQEDTPQNAEYRKARLEATFTALKSLNELSARLSAIQDRRRQHSDRTGVHFRVGHVVQHQQERWRGVVASWKTLPRAHTADGSKEQSDQLTSLTTKEYRNRVAGTDSSDTATPTVTATYDIILDATDAHAMGSSSGWAQALQSELQLVKDPALQRVRSDLLTDYFDKFNATANRFVANDLVAYQFPSDGIAEISQPTIPTEDTQLCLQVVSATKSLARRLRRCILDETSCPKDRQLTLLDTLLQRLNAVETDGVHQGDHPLSSMDDASPTTRAALHLQALLRLQLEVADVNHQRRVSKENKPKIIFGLGTVVKHKKFGFRGVVVTWDPKPTVNVRGWDGLQDIENPMQKPFYYVVPSQNDCIRIFGSPRTTRYVCQDNLEICPTNERSDLNRDMEAVLPEWTPAEGGFEAPQSYRYRFGEDLEDDGLTERCLLRMQDEFNSLYLLARQTNPSDALASQLSEHKLLKLLQIVDNAVDAHTVQDTIKEYRKAHSRRDLRWRLDTGLAELFRGETNKAIEICETVVTEDPSYAEGWNKLGTCQFACAKHADALESTKRALELDPYHTQALSALGMLHFENETYHEAAHCFRRALSLDPWSPVGSRLSTTMDLLDNISSRKDLVDD